MSTFETDRFDFKIIKIAQTQTVNVTCIEGLISPGLPTLNGIQHASQIAQMALHFVSSVRTFKMQHNPSGKVQLRAGVHSGSVVAGVVGKFLTFMENLGIAKIFRSIQTL